jgi:DedD protein
MAQGATVAALPPARMALFPFLKRREAADSPATPAEQVQRARTRARQRLIGAVVLLGLGIVGFPILFETQPRPIPVDVRIEIPHKDVVAPLAPPRSAEDDSRADGRVVAPGPVTEVDAAASAVAAKAPSAEAAAEPAAEASRPSPGVAAPATASMASAPAVATAPVGEPERSAARSPPRAAAAASTPAPTGAPTLAESGPRFVVQVGAFADRAAAQRTRERVEKLGLKTYTQVVETGEGARTRVRVGPFASRDEADRAAARLKTAGLTAAVLAL